MVNSPNLFYNIWDKEPIWMAVVAVACISAFIMFRRGITKSDDGLNFNRIYSNYGLFLLGFAASRVFFILSDFERMNYGEIRFYPQLVLASYVVGIFAAIFLISNIETIFIPKSKGILTKVFIAFALAASVGFILSFFTKDLLNIYRLGILSLSSIGFLIIFITYLKLLRNVSGELKRNVIGTLIAIFLVFIGSILDAEMIITALQIPIWVPAIPPLIGFAILPYFLRTL
jgi:hypothetical protein